MSRPLPRGKLRVAQEPQRQATHQEETWQEEGVVSGQEQQAAQRGIS